MQGLVLWGVNNIYAVLADEKQWECRFKGKRLETQDQEYNPLVPGDEVEFIADSPGFGRIQKRLERKTLFWRWNPKRRARQALVANIDVLAIVVSAKEPSWNPLFIDRALVLAEKGGIEPWILVSKSDLGFPSEYQELLERYERLYRVNFVSTLDSQGLSVWSKTLEGHKIGFVGPSGVGKSSLLNILIPSARQKTQEISLRYNRGKHTTVYAMLFPYRGAWLVDTPGVQDLNTHSFEPHDLAWCFKEFRPYLSMCRFANCLHLPSEDVIDSSCAIFQAVVRGDIALSRYTSYQRFIQDQEAY